MPDPDFFKTYGESVATRLTGIGHSPATPAFVFIEDRGDPKEVLTFTGKKAAQHAQNILVWEDYDEDVDNGSRDNYHSVWKGSVVVLAKALDAEARREVFQRTRALVLKALTLMLDDEAGGMLAEQGIEVAVRGLPLEKIGPIATSYYGYGLEFTWTVPLELMLTDDDLLA